MTAVASVAVVLATGTSAPVAAPDVVWEAEVLEDARVAQAVPTGALGKPTSAESSPAPALPPEIERAFRASPYAGGPASEARDDADVWGGLTGTEIGDAYGVGGLGLVGTGRGGGGTGEGTIGLGRGGMIGKGGGVGKLGKRGEVEEADGAYDGALQSNVLTVGTVDDNKDPAGYKKALGRMADARAALGVGDDAWSLGPPKHRHDARPSALDVALVIDTTGSMGDELEYLKVELRDIARQISKDFPGVDQRWGLVVYRDDGDAYVTRDFDFARIDEFVASLGRQEANGGGDQPEAMDAALVASEALGWRGGPETARMVFLVADAPSHEGAPARRFVEAVKQHREAGTAIFPIAGSGVAIQAEAQLRMAAKATGGQYIFLTDHSGVGGHHEAPQVEQYTVETLHAAMTRMIVQELGRPGPAPKSRPEPVAQREPTPVVEPAPAPVEPPKPVQPKPRPDLLYVDPPTPAPALVVARVEAASPGVWDELKERLAAHLLFASSMAILMFAALGLDVVLARRRRVRRFWTE